MFDPFFTTKQKGGGLGLSTAYSILQLHGGTITVESELGKGATFFLFLPALEQPAVVAPAEPEYHTGAGQVLVMDDDEAIRTMLVYFLEDLGYTAIATSEGKEALQAYQTEMAAGRSLKAIILDLQIVGGMGGKETVAELRKVDSAIPIFVSSGYSSDPILARPNEYGFTDSIGKPYRQADLEKLLNQYLRTNT
jgi:CheY-like chemotaxis protein